MAIRSKNHTQEHLHSRTLFLPIAIRLWNALPKETTEVKFVNVFINFGKRTLLKAWLETQFLLFLILYDLI